MSADKDTSRINELREELIAELAGEFEPRDVKESFESLVDGEFRQRMLQGVRPDGRNPTEIRPLSAEVGLLPRTHGAGLFQRVRNAGPWNCDSRLGGGRAKARQHQPAREQALYAALQLPTLFDGRDQEGGFAGASRDRTRSPGRKGHRPRAAHRGRIPLHGSSGVGDPGKQRQFLDGIRLRGDPVANGRGRPHQGSGCRHIDRTDNRGSG